MLEHLVFGFTVNGDSLALAGVGLAAPHLVFLFQLLQGREFTCLLKLCLWGWAYMVGLLGAEHRVLGVVRAAQSLLREITIMLHLSLQLEFLLLALENVFFQFFLS